LSKKKDYVLTYCCCLCSRKLVLYPSGNLESNGSYVSLYLAIADPEKISHGGKVNVNFKLFVYDQKNDKYLTIQGTYHTTYQSCMKSICDICLVG